MEITPNLALPYIMPSQAQKHVTHNEALRQLDAIVQLSAKSRTLSAPPLSPAEGDRYIVPPNATDGWEGQVNTVAAFQDGAWAFFTPCSGWIAWIEEESAIAAWKGDAWSKAIGPDAEFETLSVNGAVADETKPHRSFFAGSAFRSRGRQPPGQDKQEPGWRDGKFDIPDSLFGARGIRFDRRR